MSLSLNLESIILLLFFIAPGFVFTRTYTAYRPRYYREPTAFEQFVLAIVGSTVIHAAILSLFAAGGFGYWVVTGNLLYFISIQSFSGYPMPVLAIFFVSGFLYLAATLVMARRFATFLGQRSAADRPRWWRLLLGDDPPEPFLLWHTILQIEPLALDLIPPRLNIKMRSGEFFKGDLYRMRLVGDEENTVELALRNVFYRDKSGKESDNERFQTLSSQVVLLKSNDILWLTRNDQGVGSQE